MFFFKKFSKINYSFIDSPQEQKTVTNILSAFFLRRIAFSRALIFQKYSIRDDDILESLSEKLYKTPMYYWALLICNDIVNPYYEWSHPQNIIEKFTIEKYKNPKTITKIDGTVEEIPQTVGLEGIHHFFNVQTERECDDYEDLIYRSLYSDNPQSIGQNIIPVTNFQYENELNIEKKSIFVVNPGLISRFEEDFSTTFSKEK